MITPKLTTASLALKCPKLTLRLLNEVRRNWKYARHKKTMLKEEFSG